VREATQLSFVGSRAHAARADPTFREVHYEQQALGQPSFPLHTHSAGAGAAGPGGTGTSTSGPDSGRTATTDPEPEEGDSDAEDDEVPGEGEGRPLWAGEMAGGELGASPGQDNALRPAPGPSGNSYYEQKVPSLPAPPPAKKRPSRFADDLDIVRRASVLHAAQAQIALLPRTLDDTDTMMPVALGPADAESVDYPVLPPEVDALSTVSERTFADSEAANEAEDAQPTTATDAGAASDAQLPAAAAVEEEKVADVVDSGPVPGGADSAAAEHAPAQPEIKADEASAQAASEEPAEGATDPLSAQVQDEPGAAPASVEASASAVDGETAAPQEKSARSSVAGVRRAVRCVTARMTKRSHALAAGQSEASIASSGPSAPPSKRKKTKTTKPKGGAHQAATLASLAKRKTTRLSIVQVLLAENQERRLKEARSRKSQYQSHHSCVPRPRAALVRARAQYPCCA
jgi:hypothetical protein